MGCKLILADGGEVGDSEPFKLESFALVCLRRIAWAALVERKNDARMGNNTPVVKAQE